MDAKIIQLASVRQDGPVPEVIDLLKEWIEMAKKGQVLAVAVAAVCEGNELISARCENDRWAALYASLESCKHDMMMDAYKGL